MKNITKLPMGPRKNTTVTVGFLETNINGHIVKVEMLEKKANIFVDGNLVVTNHDRRVSVITILSIIDKMGGI